MASSSGNVADLLTNALEAYKEEIKLLEAKHVQEVEVLRDQILSLRNTSASSEQTKALQLVGPESPHAACGAESESSKTSPKFSSSGAREQRQGSKVTSKCSSAGPREPQTPESLSHQEGKGKDARTKQDKTIIKLIETVDEDREKSGPVGRCIEGPFDLFVCMMIGLNTAFLILELQITGPQVAAKLNIGGSSASSNESLELSLDIIEHVFNAFFIIELSLRLTIQQTRFFYSKKTRSLELLNIFDLVLVVGTSIDLYMQMFKQSLGGINFNIFRPLRFLRLVRTLRVLRTTRFLLKLRILLSTVAFSLMALFWSIVLLFATLLMASLFVNQAVTLAFSDDTISMERKEWMFRMYGTSARAFYTVFELTFSGGWPTYVRPLVEEVNPWWAVFFMTYIIVVVFAMFRIITALFLRDTLALAANDADIAVEEKMILKEATADKLLAFFNAADTSHDGILSLQEFQNMLAEPKVGAWLSLLDLDVSDAISVFDLLEEHHTYVTADDFVNGMMRIKGQARSQDMLALHHIMKKVTREIEALRTAVDGFEKVAQKTMVV